MSARAETAMADRATGRFTAGGTSHVSARPCVAYHTRARRETSQLERGVRRPRNTSAVRRRLPGGHGGAADGRDASRRSMRNDPRSPADVYDAASPEIRVHVARELRRLDESGPHPQEAGGCSYDAHLETRMNGATVLVVDDNRLFADVVASALGRLGARVLGPVRTAAGAVVSATAEKPDVVLMDPHLPDGRAVDAGRTILEGRPTPSSWRSPRRSDRRLATEVVRAGFHGFVPKDARLPTVVEAIRGAMDGRSVMIRPVHTTPAPRRGGVSPALLASELTRREREVLELLVAGLGSRAIADELGISLHTVRTHVKYILTKLQVHSRLEAAAFAVRHGLAEARRPSRASA